MRVGADDLRGRNAELERPAVGPDHVNGVAWTQQAQVAKHCRLRGQAEVAVDHGVPRLAGRRSVSVPPDNVETAWRRHGAIAVAPDRLDDSIDANARDDKAPAHRLCLYGVELQRCR